MNAMLFTWNASVVDEDVQPLFCPQHPLGTFADGLERAEVQLYHQHLLVARCFLDVLRHPLGLSRIAAREQYASVAASQVERRRFANAWKTRNKSTIREMDKWF